MRSSGQIQQKLKQVRFRHYKKEAADLLRQTPKNCVNNGTLVGGMQTPLGVCKLDFQVCDAKTQDRSGTCGNFAQAHGREEVKKSLQDFFSGRSVSDIAVRYPDVAALLWVLDGEVLEDEELPGGREDYFPGSVLVGTYFGVQLWANSESDSQTLQDTISSREAASARVAYLEHNHTRLQEEVIKAEAKTARLQEECQMHLKALALAEQVSQLSGEALASARESAKLLAAKIDFLEGELSKARQTQLQKAEPARIPFWRRVLG